MTLTAASDLIADTEDLLSNILFTEIRKLTDLIFSGDCSENLKNKNKNDNEIRKDEDEGKGRESKKRKRLLIDVKVILYDIEHST